jgi:hypothetical protein
LASTINASNTGFGGIIQQGDSSGSLQLQTAGTTALTIDASQNITTTNKLSSASMPTGSVIQIVNASYNVTTSDSTGSYVASGLTASITPSSTSSKILVIVNQLGCGKVGATYLLARLKRSSTVLATISGGSGYTNSTASNNFGGLGITWLDSPATTSSTTYSTDFATAVATNQVYVQGNGENSTITLMEIKG